MKLCFIEMLHCGIQHYSIFSVPGQPYQGPIGSVAFGAPTLQTIIL